MSDAGEEDEKERLFRRRLARQTAENEASTASEFGFRDVPDHAALLVRFMDARMNRYSPDRYDPVLGPILEGRSQRYAEIRHRGFEIAARIADTEAVRAIMALDPSVMSAQGPAD